MDVVNVAQLAGFDDLFDHLHIGVKARLEADRKDLAALFLGLYDVGRFFDGDGKRLFEKHVDTVFERGNRTARVLAVVGADADGVERFLVEHFLVIGVGVYAAYAEFVKESIGLAGNEVTAGNDFNIGKF